MAYCTQEDLLKLIPPGELAELTTEAGDEPDAAVVSEALAKADSEIDSYLGTRYAVPLSPVPAMVKSLAADLALYHLYSRRSVAPPVRRQKYVDAVAFLKEVAAGRALIDGTGGEPPAARREVAEVASASRIFTRGTQGDW